MRLNDLLLRLGKGLMLFVDLSIILLIIVLVGFAIVIVAKDLMEIWYSLSTAGMEHLQIATNDVFFLIVFMEITRSVIVGRRKPEMYLVALAEVGFCRGHKGDNSCGNRGLVHRPRARVGGVAGHGRCPLDSL